MPKWGLFLSLLTLVGGGCRFIEKRVEEKREVQVSQVSEAVAPREKANRKPVTALPATDQPPAGGGSARTNQAGDELEARRMGDFGYIGYIVVAGIVLVAFLMGGWRVSGRALRWCKRQRDEIQRRDQRSHEVATAGPEQAPVETGEAPTAGSLPADAAETPAETVEPLTSQPNTTSQENDGPCPLKEREAFLEKMAKTSLAEGDLGSFLLRRDDVPGQHVAAYCANLLVSVALIFTIVGLFLTLRGLGTALRENPMGLQPTPAMTIGNTAAPGQTDLVEKLMDRIQGPLGHLHFMFIPTALGLILAMASTWRQRRIDEELEKTWQEIDLHTQTVLLPQYVTRAGSPIEIAEKQRSAVESLEKASVQFAEGASTMAETFGSVRQGLEELGKLDQARWAQDLMKAARDFREQVKESGQVLTNSLQTLPDVSREISVSATQLGQAAKQVTGAGESVAGASASLTTAAQETKQVLGTLAETQKQVLALSDSVQGLSTAMATLNGNFTGWSESLGKLLVDLKQTVVGLGKAVYPLMEQAKTLNDYIQNNAQATLSALNGTWKQFAACNKQLSEIFAQHHDTFGALGKQVAASLREGHERFLVEVNGRLDQGEGLYQRLENLRLSLEDNAGALRGFGQDLRTIPSFLDTHQATAETTQKALQQLHATVQEMAEVLQDQNERWRQQLQAQAQAAHLLDTHQATAETTQKALQQLHATVQEMAKALQDQTAQTRQRDEWWLQQLQAQAQQQAKVVQNICEKIDQIATQQPFAILPRLQQWWKKLSGYWPWRR